MPPKQLITPPTAEPVSVASLKVHCRIDVSDDDGYLATLIAAARGRLEELTRRAILCQTWDLKLDAFPAEIRVPLPPLVAVSSITYVDTAGATQTLDADDYVVDAVSQPGRITQAYGVAWPSTYAEPNVVTVRFVAGYAAPFTVNATSNLLTAGGGRTFTDGEVVRVSTTDADLPVPLAAMTDYYVRDASGATCKLALTSGGAAIDITDAGVGTHFIGEVPAALCHAVKMLCGHWYENRETVVVGQTASEMPDAVEALAWQFRIDL